MLRYSPYFLNFLMGDSSCLYNLLWNKNKSCGSYPCSPTPCENSKIFQVIAVLTYYLLIQLILVSMDDAEAMKIS